MGMSASTAVNTVTSNCSNGPHSINRGSVHHGLHVRTQRHTAAAHAGPNIAGLTPCYIILIPSTTPIKPCTHCQRGSMSAYLQNCTVPDDYLLKLIGKRMSQILNLTPKKEKRHTFRSLHAAFSKVGMALKASHSKIEPNMEGQRRFAETVPQQFNL